MPPDNPNEKWELPERLRITNPDVLTRANALAAELAVRVASPFGRLSPQEQERASAALMADHLKKDLERVNLQITEIVLVDGRDSQSRKLTELLEARYHISRRLAEAYVSIGRFDLAAEIDPRPESRDEYVEILEAINRDDGEWNCECAPGRDFIKREVFSLKHNRMMPMRKCSGCGEMNVAPLPVHIAEQRAHRARARELVADKSPEEAKAILSREGHTTEKLISK